MNPVSTAATDDAPAGQACSECGSREIRPETVRSAFWHGERLVVVEDISAAVCGGCGEQFFDDQTVMLLDMLRGEGFPTAKASGEMVASVFSLKAGRD